MNYQARTTFFARRKGRLNPLRRVTGFLLRDV
jgi:hypothetical protein